MVMHALDKKVPLKYFIGYLIEGEAGQWCAEITKKISEIFSTWKLHEKIPPHVTLVRPFETDDINPVKNFLKSWTQGRPIPGNFILSGFGHFDDRVVFIQVEAEEPVIQTVKELRKNLKDIVGIPNQEDSRVWHPHATIANHLSEPEIQRIWDYVQTLKKPNYMLPFDTITIFRFEGERKWTIEETFRFNSVT